MRTGKVGSQQVAILNSENLDEKDNSEIVRHLTITHRLVPRILITTSVLDNGVSIQDSEVENLVIITESRLSFLQMLGRVRAESSGKCNLYFIARNEEIFQRRMERYQELSNCYVELEKENLGRKLDFYMKYVWDGEGKADFYRNALVIMRHDYHFFTLPKGRIQVEYGDEGLYINKFGRKKTGDMYVTESRLYALALENPLQVIFSQMTWIGKQKEDLQILKDMCKEQRQGEFLARLLEVRGYTQEELKSFKEEIVREYRKDFFPEILANNGTISNEKLDKICQKFGLTLRSEEDSADRRKRYFIEENGE